MLIGDCFMMAVPPKYDREHLWIVLSLPASDGKIIIVNVTSDLLRAGREFVLLAGTHKRITHESYVSFSDALLVLPANIERLVGKLVILEAPLTPELVAQIIAVAKAGKSMPDEFKRRL